MPPRKHKKTKNPVYNKGKTSANIFSNVILKKRLINLLKELTVPKNKSVKSPKRKTGCLK